MQPCPDNTQLSNTSILDHKIKNSNIKPNIELSDPVDKLHSVVVEFDTDRHHTNTADTVQKEVHVGKDVS